MNVLVDNDLLSSPVVAQSKDAVYLWSFDSQVWYMVGSETFYTIVDTDWFTISNIGWFQGAYIETEKDVLLLFKMNSKLIKELQQDIFTNKGLTSFVFSSSSVVTRIHARAFYNNELSTIVFPETLNRIDLWAFKDNNITKITVGSQLTSIGTTTFRINHTGFVDAYTIGVAGTYSYTEDVLVKQ